MSLTKVLTYSCDAEGCTRSAIVAVPAGGAEALPAGWYTELGQRVHACSHEHADVINAAQIEKTGKRYLWVEYR